MGFSNGGKKRRRKVFDLKVEQSYVIYFSVHKFQISYVLLKLTPCYRFVPTLFTLIMNLKWFMLTSKVFPNLGPCYKSIPTSFTSKGNSSSLKLSLNIPFLHDVQIILVNKELYYIKALGTLCASIWWNL